MKEIIFSFLIATSRGAAAPRFAEAETRRQICRLFTLCGSQGRDSALHADVMYRGAETLGTHFPLQVFSDVDH